MYLCRGIFCVWRCACTVHAATSITIASRFEANTFHPLVRKCLHRAQRHVADHQQRNKDGQIRPLHFTCFLLCCVTTHSWPVKENQLCSVDPGGQQNGGRGGEREHKAKRQRRRKRGESVEERHDGDDNVWARCRGNRGPGSGSQKEHDMTERWEPNDREEDRRGSVSPSHSSSTWNETNLKLLQPWIIQRWTRQRGGVINTSTCTRKGVYLLLLLFILLLYIYYYLLLLLFIYYYLFITTIYLLLFINYVLLLLKGVYVLLILLFFSINYCTIIHLLLFITTIYLLIFIYYYLFITIQLLFNTTFYLLLKVSFYYYWRDGYLHLNHLTPAAI